VKQTIAFLFAVLCWKKKKKKKEKKKWRVTFNFDVVVKAVGGHIARR